MSDHNKKLTILVSNDDGVHAPGIAALNQSLSTIATTHVVAPDRNKSGVSSAITLHKPLRYMNLDNGFTSVEGTPSDCVYLASAGLLDNVNIDLVVSGVNSGPNLGDDVIYSGTLSAAIAGRMLGLPSIAVSLVYEEKTHKEGQPRHFETAAHVVKKIIENWHLASLPKRSLLNVNVPNVPIDELNGYEITRLGTRLFSKPVIAEKDPRAKGQVIYWIGPVGEEQDAGNGTDFRAVKNNSVSITPLSLDFTDHELLKEIASWKPKLDFSGS